MRRMKRELPIIVLILSLVSVPVTLAHISLRNYIQHHIAITASAENIDIVVDLSFYENCAARERIKMDADHDGRISDSEVRAYLDKIAEKVQDGLRLSIDGRPVDLLVLHEPKLDLMGFAQTGPHPHLLHLFYFARTPEALKTGATIALTDSLWPDVDAIRGVEIQGKDGFRFSAIPTRDSGVWQGKCVASATRVSASEARETSRQHVSERR